MNGESGTRFWVWIMLYIQRQQNVELKAMKVARRRKCYGRNPAVANFLTMMSNGPA
jgi:hypothetical protein